MTMATALAKKTPLREPRMAERPSSTQRSSGCKLPDAKVIVVRDVAPQKLMLCLTFQVPEEIGWKKEQGEGSAAKRQRSE